MARNRLVRLTWVDDQGEPYHTADLKPTVAKEMLIRAGVHWIDCPGQWRGHTLSSFSRAEVERSSRGLVGKKDRTGGVAAVIITLPEDNPEQ